MRNVLDRSKNTPEYKHQEEEYEGKMYQNEIEQ